MLKMLSCQNLYIKIKLFSLFEEKVFWINIWSIYATVNTYWTIINNVLSVNFFYLPKFMLKASWRRFRLRLVLALSVTASVLIYLVQALSVMASVSVTPGLRFKGHRSVMVFALFNANLFFFFGVKVHGWSYFMLYDSEYMVVIIGLIWVQVPFQKSVTFVVYNAEIYFFDLK